VRLWTDDGQEWTEEVLANRGGPARPLSEDELALKFSTNVAGRLEATDATEVRRQILRLDELQDLDDVMTSLSRLIRPITIEPSTAGSSQ
jgi:hypothetical protein